MKENQSIEFKESWSDNHLAVIAGMANASGGRFYIGVNDNGDVIGVNQVEHLLIDIPNRVKSLLKIMVDVNLLEKEEKEYLEIVVNKTQEIVTYKGQYYYRSGASNHHLKDELLDEFIAKKSKYTWEQMTQEGVSIESLDNESFNIFKEYSLKSKNLSKDDLKIDNNVLLNNLELLKSSLLTKASVLLFYKDPTMYFNSAYIKIIFYKNNELFYMEDYKGSLIYVITTLLDYISKNYLEKYNLNYSLITLNELINNAIIHNDYSSNNPITITIKENEIEISNSIHLNIEIDKKKYLNNKVTIYNKLIANTFYKMGIYNGWGRGIKNIIKDSKKNKCKKPEFIIVDNKLIVKITKIEKKEKVIKREKEGKITGIQNYLVFHNYDISSLNDNEKEWLYILIEKIIFKGSLSLLEIVNILKIKESKCKEYLNKIININIITYEESSRGLKYSLTKKHNLNN